ncbi:MAG: hypothetical protein GXP01_06020 [Alphaproteobacteria bacterium]|nr:hypothetical protein [Alphaproteobacteria bacterium]
MKFVFIITLILILSGCVLESDYRLISPSQSEDIFANNTNLVQSGENEFSVFKIIKNGNNYELRSASVKSEDNLVSFSYETMSKEVLISGMPNYPDYFALQMSVADDSFQHFLIRVTGRNVGLGIIDVEAVMEAGYVLRGISKNDAGEWIVTDRVFLDRLYTAAIDQGVLGQDETGDPESGMRSYNMDDPVQAAEFEAALEAAILREEIKIGARPAATSFNPDILKNEWSELVPAGRTLLQEMAPVDGVIQFEADVKAEMLRLPWYDRGYLVGVYGGWTPQNLIFYYLYDGDDEMVRLDGKALGLHGFNAKNPLKINESTVLPYLWFFTFFVRGDDGPFLLAQNANDRFLPKELEDYDIQTQNALRDLPRPAVCEQQSEAEGFECSAVVMYSNALFDALFSVSPLGEIVMKEDVVIGENLSERVDAPISAGEVNGQVQKISISAL